MKTTNPSSIIQKIRKELRDTSDEKTRQISQRFFKESVKIYGIRAAQVNKISKENLKHLGNTSKKEVFNVCQELWQSGMMEECIIACHWTYAMRKDFQAEDMQLFEIWVNSYITNWATCDTFCNHSVGSFIQQFPEHLETLKRWTHSPNLWMRRAAAVSLIVPVRKGEFIDTAFEIADILLMDKEDMVQKGYGWLLKVASQSNQQQVFDYVLAQKERMPRTALRYAIEKMPLELKKEAMKRTSLQINTNGNSKQGVPTKPKP